MREEKVGFKRGERGLSGQKQDFGTQCYLS